VPTETTVAHARFGFQMDHPEHFALDPGSVPGAGDIARFWTPDRRATAVVAGSHNLTGLSVEQIMQDAERDILHNGRGDMRAAGAACTAARERNPGCASQA